MTPTSTVGSTVALVALAACAPPTSPTLECLTMPTEAKDELDAVSFLARGCTISTMGQLHFKRLIEDKAIVAFFGREDIALAQPVPGFRYRIPEFQVDWDWNVADREYEAVQYAVHAEGLLNLGKGRIDAPRSLDEINPAIAKWIDNETLANEVAADIARTLGTGLILWQFQSTYRYPELEIGDKVALETRLFIAKDPNSGRVLKGQIYAVGTIVKMHPDGRQFAAWVQGFGDLLTAAEAVTRLGFGGVATRIYLSQDVATFGEVINEWDEVAHDTHGQFDAGDPERITLSQSGAGRRVQVKANIVYEDLVQESDVTWSVHLQHHNPNATIKAFLATQRVAAVDAPSSGSWNVVGTAVDPLPGEFFRVNIIRSGFSSNSITLIGGSEEDTHFEVVTLNR